eukprot:scaffold16827_cov79-Skeletonema_dohrnii-CCMP3373.AAC.1
MTRVSPTPSVNVVDSLRKFLEERIEAVLAPLQLLLHASSLGFGIVLILVLFGILHRRERRIKRRAELLCIGACSFAATRTTAASINAEQSSSKRLSMSGLLALYRNRSRSTPNLACFYQAEHEHIMYVRTILLIHARLGSSNSSRPISPLPRQDHGSPTRVNKCCNI